MDLSDPWANKVWQKLWAGLLAKYLTKDFEQLQIYECNANHSNERVNICFPALHECSSQTTDGKMNRGKGLFFQEKSLKEILTHFAFFM